MPLTELKRNFIVNLPGLMSAYVPTARKELAESAYSRWMGEGGGNVDHRRPRRGRAHVRGRGRRSRRAAGRERTARRRGHHAARRRGGHRRHHQLHQHLEPVGHDRRRPAGQEGGGARAHDPAVGQDQPGPRLAGRDRLSRGLGPAAVPRAARLQHRGLRLHDLHRQQRPAAGRDRRRSSTSTRW